MRNARNIASGGLLADCEGCRRRMAATRLLLFGTLHICHADRTVAVTSAPMRALLGYLAIHASGGRVVLRELIAHHVWPDLDESHGRNALSSTLYRLQRLLDHQTS